MKHRRISFPPSRDSMSDAQDASGLFAKATEILRETGPAAPSTVDPALGRARGKSVRDIAKRLCSLLEEGGSLENIDKEAKALGMEVLGIQQLTLQARKRTK